MTPFTLGSSADRSATHNALDLAHYRGPVSAALGDAFDRITAEGREMMTDDAIAFARQHDGC